MFCELEDIVNFCGSNYSGLTSVKIIATSDLASMPASCCCPCISSIPLQTGKKWADIFFDAFSAQFDEKTNISNKAGDFYEASVRFTIKRQRKETINFVSKMRNRRAHLWVTDANGESYFLPFMRLAAERTTDNNRISYVFTNKTVKTTKLYGTCSDTDTCIGRTFVVEYFEGLTSGNTITLASPISAGSQISVFYNGWNYNTFTKLNDTTIQFADSFDVGSTFDAETSVAIFYDTDPTCPSQAKTSYFFYGLTSGDTINVPTTIPANTTVLIKRNNVLQHPNNWGWRLEFSVKISVSTCINPFSWQ